jgi:hypothetical protein
MLVNPATTDRAVAECAFESVQGEGVYGRHLPQTCSPQDRERLAIQAGDLLEAITQGKTVDLDGVIIVGDLVLDQLPARPLDSVVSKAPHLRDALGADQSDDVRLVRSLLIRGSEVRGRFVSNLRQGVLLVEGPVAFTGTSFEAPVDLSRTVFLGPFDASDAVFHREAFFVQCKFTQPARFERTAFGVHSRFHRTEFDESVSFLRAGFNGLAEFMEVSFKKDASFSRTYFRQGTGFSGSRFYAGLDFSEATFEREAYFLFTRFEGDAYFRRATFHGPADFSDAQFNGLGDFSKTYFEAVPQFGGAKRGGGHRSLGGLQNPTILFAIVLALAVFSIIFLVVLRRM